MIRFFSDSAVELPLLTSGGAHDGDGVGSSPDRIERLRAWTTHWAVGQNDRGWVEAEDHWFQQERRALADAVAQEVGVEFAVVTEDAVFRSIDPPTRPEAAAALHRNALEWAEIRASGTRGAQFRWSA